MNKENKKQIMQLILKLNLIIGIYNIFLFTYGHTLFNLIIGSTNIGVWAFLRDEKLLLLLKNIKLKNR